MQVHCVRVQLRQQSAISGADGTLIGEHREPNILKATKEHHATGTVNLLAVGSGICIQESWRRRVDHRCEIDYDCHSYGLQEGEYVSVVVVLQVGDALL